MKTGSRYLKILSTLVLTTAASLILVNCGNKNSANHAPVCAVGTEALYYDGTNYNCRAITYAQQYGNQYGVQYGTQYGQYPQQYPQNPQANVAGQATQAPVSTCSTNQVLVNWTGNWFCFFSDIIYPSGDSPRGVLPPQQRGGELCTPGAGQQQYSQYPQQNYGTQYSQYPQQNMFSPYALNCTQGFYCTSSQGQQPLQQQYPQGSYPQGMTPGMQGICTHI